MYACVLVCVCHTIYFICGYLGHERAFTCDTKGTFKLWEIRRSLTGMATCVQVRDNVSYCAHPSHFNGFTTSQDANQKIYKQFSDWYTVRMHQMIAPP